MSALVVLANHSSDHWAVNALLFLGPVVVLAVVLVVWSRRKGDEADPEAEPPAGDDSSRASRSS